MGMGRQFHRAITILLTLVGFAVLGLGGLGWRLSQGPVNITWLTRHVIPSWVEVGDAALAWEGWRKGLDHPLDIRLRKISATGAGGATLALIPEARVSVSFAWLLVGRVVPRAIEIDGARVRAVRGVDGQISTVLGSLDTDAPDVDVGPNPFGAILSELSRAAQTDANSSRSEGLTWSQLRLVRIADAQGILADRQLGVIWRAPSVTVMFTRGATGGVAGRADITLAVGQQSAQVTATAELQPDGKSTAIHAEFSPLAPASLAGLSPALAPLQAVDAPIAGGIDFTIGPQFDVSAAQLAVHVGAGTVHIGQGAVAISEGRFRLLADRAGIKLSDATLGFGAGRNGPGPVVQAHGALSVGPQKLYAGTLSVALDQVSFADLAQYWPAGVAASARSWMTSNITAGVARAAHADLQFTYGDAAGLQLTGATGGLRGDDVTITWLRPVPPVEHAQATLSIISPDELLITTSSGHQVGGDLHTGQGAMRITGLSQKDQASTIDLAMTGPLGDAWNLLHQPRLNLLSHHPIDLGDPTGQITTHLHLEMPLDDKVTMDQMVIHASGQITNGHMSFAGRSIDQAALDFDATGDALKVAGPLQVAGISAQFGVQMDFRPGPPGQVQTRVTLSGDATIAQLSAAGLDSYGLLSSGHAALNATLEERRDGSGQVSVHGDLLNAGLRLSPTGWKRDAGGTAQGDVHILLDHDQFAGIDRLTLEGDGVSVLGRADGSAGQATTLRLEHVVLGDTRANGTIRFGRPPGGRIDVSLSGACLDLSGRFETKTPASSPAKPATSGPAWSADLRFDKLLLAGRRSLLGVSVQAEDDGQIVRRAQVRGNTGRQDAFSLSIEPEPDGRRLSAQAADAGALLAAADIAQVVQGGTLSVTGRYDDRTAEHRLSGTADFSNFQVHGATAAAKLLQAMTLYGLVDALRGPGLGVSRMVMPFTKAGDIVDISEARAFNASLGITAKGRVDLAANTADLQGTIVPAYFFNTLLGSLPIVGQLFSPEKGGGVFAATYFVKGPLDDPNVGVNPLAALTPGFLRGLFDIFNAK
jgi:hypothetical protein